MLVTAKPATHLFALPPLAAALCALAFAASADLYWCETGPNRSGLFQKQVDGAECRLIEKDDPEQAAAPMLPGGNGAVLQGEEAVLERGNRPSDGTLEGFPRVSEEEQTSRDDTRRTILRSELEGERAEFQHIRSILNSNRSTTFEDPVRDHYMTRLKRHAQNIRALQQELARLQ